MNPTPIVVLLLAGFAARAAAQAPAPTISTDRPDFVESSQTVGRGRFQFETSVSRDATTWGSPTLLRYGISERVELRVETDGVQRTSHATGMADAALGVKWHVRRGVGVLVHADLPSGSPLFRGRGVRPSLRGVAEWALPADFSLGMMPGVIYDEDDAGHRFVTGLFGVTLGHAWTDSFRTFVEYSAQALNASAHGPDFITYDAGAAFLLRRNWQIDGAVSFGSGSAPDVAFTFGLSALLP